MIELLPKQEELITTDADIVLYGGARGGAKTFGSSAAASLEAIEVYTESEMRIKGLDFRTYRKKEGGLYFRYLTDYPYYNGVIIRRSLPALRANTLVETRKIYPLLGASFDKEDYSWVFPSGAKIYLRPLYDDRTLDYFQGPSFQRFIVEELTQFEQEMIEKAQVCCRTAKPIGDGVVIPAKIIYTTNPGGKGHLWVKEEIVNKCPPVPDGDPVYLEEHDISYQPMRSGEPYINDYGEKVLYIPSLLFDNPHITEHDPRYLRNLLNMNKSLRDMWLFASWDAYVGQFFDMWDESIHVIDELEFFGCKSQTELVEARRRFNWVDNGYRLYLSNDYGFRAPWACGAYAVDRDLNIIKFAEIVESGLSINQQAKYTKNFFLINYNLKISDFELVIADPKSYWEHRDKGTVFYTFAEEYQREGIVLTKGKNDRVPGAAALVEALMPQDNGCPKLRYLSNCSYNIASIPSLSQHPNNPEDVDSSNRDHSYDETRYFLMIVIGEPSRKMVDRKHTGWRANLKGEKKDEEESISARTYLTA